MKKTLQTQREIEIERKLKAIERTLREALLKIEALKKQVK